MTTLSHMRRLTLRESLTTSSPHTLSWEWSSLLLSLGYLYTWGIESSMKGVLFSCRKDKQEELSFVNFLSEHNWVPLWSSKWKFSLLNVHIGDPSHAYLWTENNWQFQICIQSLLNTCLLSVCPYICIEPHLIQI